MAFNIKVSVVLLVLLVMATISANARADLSEVSVEPESAGRWPKFCSTCGCRKESGITKCYRSETKVGGCPLACGSSCKVCTRSIPPICSCIYEVETCTPKQCSLSTPPKLENLLSLNPNY
ncbi:hypothetical protein TIFTF001_023854 [Ficus carica]|uniref:Uncharacterized protein n=1 Tax=Ficus carica TaxID=3494 RepID=A0AA88AXC5_FICCA|nr:hypothetical protein TIFTF001_023854 [Ficus carica]